MTRTSGFIDRHSNGCNRKRTNHDDVCARERKQNVCMKRETGKEEEGEEKKLNHDVKPIVSNLSY